MPEDVPILDYVLIREGCDFTFLEGSEGESVNFDQAPQHVRFAFQGLALAQFIRACIRLLRRQMDEAATQDPERFAHLKAAGKDIVTEWDDAGLP